MSLQLKCGSALHCFPLADVRMACLNWNSTLYNFYNPIPVCYPVVKTWRTLFCHQELQLSNTLWRGHYQELHLPEWIRTGFTALLVLQNRQIYPVQQPALLKVPADNFYNMSLELSLQWSNAALYCPRKKILRRQSISLHIPLAATKDLCDISL